MRLKKICTIFAFATAFLFVTTGHATTWNQCENLSGRYIDQGLPKDFSGIELTQTDCDSLTIKYFNQETCELTEPTTWVIDGKTHVWNDKLYWFSWSSSKKLTFAFDSPDKPPVLSRVRGFYELVAEGKLEWSQHVTSSIGDNNHVSGRSYTKVTDLCE